MEGGHGVGAEAPLLQGLPVKPQAAHRRAVLQSDLMISEVSSNLSDPTMIPQQQKHAPSASAHGCCQPPALSKSWRGGTCQLKCNLSAHTWVLSVQAHRNGKQSNPHPPGSNQHLRLTQNRSNLRTTCVSNAPLVPGTPGAPARRSPLLNQPRSSHKAGDTTHTCLGVLSAATALSRTYLRVNVAQFNHSFSFTESIHVCNLLLPNLLLQLAVGFLLLIQKQKSPDWFSSSG